jgi:hypothetical protein
MPRPAAVLALLALSVAAHPAIAQSPPAAAGPPPCTGPEHRQFDFWLGRWEVASPAGRAQGTNEITRALGQCALRERWRGVGGMSGESLNTYDAARRVWHQTWVDDRGTVLLVDGGWRDSAMVMEGVLPGPGGRPQRQRIRWTPRSRDEVHQVWETSDDDGSTWKTSFHGVYRRVGE